MILNFDEFQKANQSGSELNNIRIKNLNIFKEKGFPSKREENWKYTDLKTILSNNLNKLEIPNNKKTSQYNNEWLLKNFQHNQIILVNGDFVSSNFNFELIPNRVAPFFLGCLNAISLEETTDFLFSDAIATEALSIILFIDISIASLFNLELSLAISAIFQASCFFLGKFILEG